MGRPRVLAVLAGMAVALAAAPDGRAQQRLQEVVAAFDQQGTAAQRKQLGEAMAASPALAQRLEAAADAGHFTAIEIVPGQKLPNTPFLATIDHGRILLSADFLDRVATRRLSDVVQRDDVLPNNLVFVLGSLLSHLQAPAATPPSDMQAFIKAKIEKDARAFIQGWNDVVDAAEKANGNRYLTQQQQGSLLANLRYRTVFVGRDGRRIVPWTSSGVIDPADRNVALLAESLQRGNLLDFGVPPDQPAR